MIERLAGGLYEQAGPTRRDASDREAPAQEGRIARDGAWDPGACRQYLLMVANAVMGTELQGKVGASDLVQETFLEAQRHIAGYRGRSKAELRAWLRRILECRLANLRRHYLKASKRTVGLGGPRAARPTFEVISPDPSPSAHAVRNESVAELECAMERLPGQYRSVVALRHREQLSWEAIGRRLGTSPDAARMLWGRAVRRLRREMGDGT